MSTKHMDYWNQFLWSDEMKINLFGSDGFKHVWRQPGEEYTDNRTSLRDPQVEGGGVQSLKYLPAPQCHHGGVEEHFSGYL